MKQTTEDIDSSEELCDAPEDFPNTERSGSVVHWKAKVTYTCTDGYVFPDGNSTKVLLCQLNGRWNDTITDCVKGLFLMELEQITLPSK